MLQNSFFLVALHSPAEIFSQILLLSPTRASRPRPNSFHRIDGGRIIKDDVPYLSKSDILALFPETLPADIEAVFADQTGFVGADAAVDSTRLTY